MTMLTVNGNPYSDDGSTPNDMLNGGFRDHFLPFISDVLTDTSGKVTSCNASAAAAQAAASTAVSAPGTSATSVSSLTIALGTKSLVIQPGKLLSPGMPITIASSASPQNWMNGSCDSYNSVSGALQVNVTNIGVATPGVYPTLAAWTVSISGPAGVTGVLNELKGASIPSAATINLDSATGNLLHITGTNTITAITIASGAERTLVFDGALVLTHNATTLILPSGANISTAAGDVAMVRGDGTGNARVVSYQRSNGLGVVGAPYAKFSDQKANGSSGGAAVAADITQTRTLNTTDVNGIPGASLSSNTVTLPSGTYQFRARAMAYQVNAHKAFLYNASDATYAGVGSTERAGSSADIFTTSVVSGQFSISAPKNFTLRHYTQVAAPTGMGIAVSSGQVEVYSELEFWKVA